MASCLFCHPFLYFHVERACKDELLTRVISRKQMHTCIICSSAVEGRTWRVCWYTSNGKAEVLTKCGSFSLKTRDPVQHLDYFQLPRPVFQRWSISNSVEFQDKG